MSIFNDAASARAALKDFSAKFTNQPQHYRIVLALEEHGHIPKEQQDISALTRREEDLQRKIQQSPDLPDAARWKEERTGIPARKEALQTALDAKLDVLAEEFFQTIPHRLNLDPAMFERNMTDYGREKVCFDVKIPTQAAMTLQHIDMPGRKLYVGLRKNSLPEHSQDGIQALALRFADLVDYMKGLRIPGKDIGHALEAATEHDGFIGQLRRAQNDKDFTLALSLADYAISPALEFKRPFDGDDYKQGLQFPFVRTVLAARAAWYGDETAKLLLEDLDPFLQLPSKPSGGSRGQCAEQDYIGYISDLYKMATRFEGKPLQYTLSIGFRQGEIPRIEQEVKDEFGDIKAAEARAKELGSQISSHGNDDDYQTSVDGWKAELEALRAQFKDYNPAIERKKAAQQAANVETVLAVIRENMPDIPVAKDLYHNTFKVIATSDQIETLGKLLNDIGCGKFLPETPHWDFVYAVNGFKIREDADDSWIPGATEFKPRLMALKPQDGPQPGMHA